MTGAGAPNMVMIYNEAQKSTTFREIPHTRHASYAPAMRSVADDSFDGGDDGSGDTFDGESTLIFDLVAETTLSPHFFMLNEDDDDIEEFNEDIYQDVGVDKRSYLERRTMPFAGVGKGGNMIVDLQQMKFFTELWPHIVGAAGVQITVTFGIQNFVDEAITWLPTVLYTIGTTEVVPIYQTARFLSVRFEATGNDVWELHGFTYEVQPTGRY